MKKIILGLCIFLCAAGLFAQKKAADPVPDWAISVIAGEPNKKIAEKLDIDMETYKIFLYGDKKSSADTFDLKKQGYIEVENTISAYMEQTVESSDSLVTKKTTASGRVAEVNDEKVILYYINPETGKNIPFMESSRKEIKHYGENYDEIINLLKKNSSVAKAMKLEAEYYTFSKKDKNGKNMVVDSGTSATTKAKYDQCVYCAVYIIPTAVYDNLIKESIESMKIDQESLTDFLQDVIVY